MSLSDRLAKLKSFRDLLDEKKAEPEGEFANFLFQEREGFSFCPLCVDEQGEEVKPLRYPAVKICVRRPQAKQVEIKGGKGLHWHWEFTNFCIAHAIEVLVAMEPADIMPRPEDISDAEVQG